MLRSQTEQADELPESGTREHDVPFVLHRAPWVGFAHITVVLAHHVTLMCACSATDLSVELAADVSCVCPCPCWPAVCAPCSVCPFVALFVCVCPFDAPRCPPVPREAGSHGCAHRRRSCSSRIRLVYVAKKCDRAPMLTYMRWPRPYSASVPQRLRLARGFSSRSHHTSHWHMGTHAWAWVCVNMTPKNFGRSRLL